MSGRQIEIELKNDLGELERLGNWLSIWAERESIDPKTMFQLNLVCDELITNTILYGFRADEIHTIRVAVTKDPKGIELTIMDDGLAFDPFSLSSPALDLEMDEREIGGLGIHFVRETMDEVSYERIGCFNIIRLKKMGQSPAEGLA
jgi:serine/threonine-protein kinase RsbW